MSQKSTFVLLAGLALAACSSAPPQPHVIQSSMSSPDITIVTGMATQIEMPDEARVQSLVVGNSALIEASQAGDVVNLSAKGDAGETNLIIRARGEDGQTKIYQYHITVQKQ